ncbi:peroxide stress protein YaaA [Hamadaea tsunoensis]|uniref:peroxide stress protein YaaA n=1 Tax=Hamadaea tsunoensis TaxID=53368 RepID=UPI00042562EB|nr:peroxide stress protein YaaA [Hamadaea tsunoensis]
MLVLLPPSEGKAAVATGPALDLAGLSFPELNRARTRTLTALVKLCARKRPGPALEALGLSSGQTGEVEKNAGLKDAPTMTAAELYTGVLYDALELATLPPDASAAAADAIVISSGLWGGVRLTDRIPSYRCSIGANLPPLGGLAAFWRKHLSLPADGLVLDLRSSAYAAMWTPPADRTATVRVLHERAGKRTVVSHFNKATKGRLLRDLLIAGVRPSTPAELAGALRDLKYTVEEARPGALDVIVHEL